MFYRENGQFKSSYRTDQQIFPIRQDRVFIAALLIVAFVVVPVFGSGYFMQAILTPFLILSLAAIGLNVLVGYCGQISLGSGAFMAVGAYRSEEPTSELQSLMRISYAVFCLKKKNHHKTRILHRLQQNNKQD